MKRKIINIVIIILVVCLYFFVYSLIYDNFRERKRQELESNIVKEVDKIIDKKEKIVEKKVSVNKMRYTVLGKIEIKKINFYQSVLKENTAKAMNISVTKLAGPNLNMVGNVVIAGHNYMRKEYFYRIRRLKKGDIIKLTDLSGISVLYKVEYGRKTSISDVSYFKTSKENTRELTLVTCVPRTKERFYIKAYEK